MERHKVEPIALTKEELGRAPWMQIALDELGKGVRENRADKDFEQQFFYSLAQHNPRLSLLDWNKLDRDLAGEFADKTGNILMETGNPEISKYLRSTHLQTLTKRDSTRDRKGHEIDHEWRMQAWCAAFVNWCLQTVGVKPLGSARASDWLKFGMVVTYPHRGAIVITAPSKATNAKGGSGHVAFFGGFEGRNVWILGGNQHRQVCWMKKSSESVRGFRWPTVLGDFETNKSSAEIA